MGNINFLVVFMEGLISFLSPCVLPIIPVYIAILTGSTGNKEEDNQVKKPILNTFLFILGISTTFFLLGSSIKFFSDIIFKNKNLLNLVGGILIVIMGLFFMGILKIPGLSQSKKFSMKDRKMSPLTAYLLGLTFSLGWSPCIGPMLGSAIIMASGTGSKFQGNLMILVYTLGFVVPFIILALFYDKLADKIDKLHEHSDKIKKLGGILLIVSGLLMAFGGLDKFGDKISSQDQPSLVEEKEEINEDEVLDQEDEVNEETKEAPPAPNFELMDQYGNLHTLSQYEGKVVLLNFWATWCTYCKKSMPDIEDIYKEYGENKEDIIILGVAAPNMGNEKDQKYIEDFLEKNNYTHPVIFDLDGKMTMDYMVQGLPNSFVINKDGSVEGYIPGAVPKEFLKEVLQEALDK